MFSDPLTLAGLSESVAKLQTKSGMTKKSGLFFAAYFSKMDVAFFERC